MLLRGLVVVKNLDLIVYSLLLRHLFVHLKKFILSSRYLLLLIGKTLPLLSDDS